MRLQNEEKQEEKHDKLLEKISEHKKIERIVVKTGNRIDIGNIDLRTGVILGTNQTIRPRAFAWNLRIDIDSVFVLHDDEKSLKGEREGFQEKRSK